MSLLWLALALGLMAVVVVVTLASAKEADAVVRRWQASVQKLGLKFQRMEQQRRMWRGKCHGQPVQAELNTVPQHGSYGMTLSTGANAGIPSGLEVYCESTLHSLGRLVGSVERDVTLGDAAFDDVAVLPALDAYTCAALSHGARSQLITLLRRGGWVHERRVVLSAFWSWQSEEASLGEQLRWLCRLSTLLSVPRASLHERLATNAVRDPAPAVRLQNLRFLAAAETRTPPALLASTARSLLADVHAPVRLLAARQLGAEGVPALRSLLVQGTPPEHVCATLAVLPTALAADMIESVLGCTRSEQESVRAEAARVLGSWARPEAEPTLITLLADPSSQVQLASARALGRFGSVAAVQHLLPLTQGLLDLELRQASRAAMGHIQSRLGNVEAGRVSLAEQGSLAGALALVEPAALRAGALSLDEELAADAATTEEEAGAQSQRSR